MSESGAHNMAIGSERCEALASPMVSSHRSHPQQSKDGPQFRVEQIGSGDVYASGQMGTTTHSNRIEGNSHRNSHQQKLASPLREANL
jgi:hypothetical protein